MISRVIASLNEKCSHMRSSLPLCIINTAALKALKLKQIQLRFLSTTTVKLQQKMTTSSNLGFPRMGENRELKNLVENYWSQKISLNELETGAKELKKLHWSLQKSKGIQFIPSNDFSLYDHVLDHICLFGAVPPRYSTVMEIDNNSVGLQTYFAMARGNQSQINEKKKIDVGSMEMKKWFDTNYHYIVPEFYPNQNFQLITNSQGLPKPVEDYLEAKSIGIETRPVILGPISFLLLGKSGISTSPFKTRIEAVELYLDSLLPIYVRLFSQLEQSGVQWIQIDEPILCLDLGYDSVDSLNRLSEYYQKVYTTLRQSSPSVKFLLATYFGDLRDNYEHIVQKVSIDALHIDLVRGSSEEFSNILNTLPSNVSLSVGVIDGRNIWKADYEKSLSLLDKAIQKLGHQRVIVAPSCSLLHCPHSLKREINKMDPEIIDWLSFASEKLDEINFLAQACNQQPLTNQLKELYEANQVSNQKRKTSTRIHKDHVQKRMSNITSDMFSRQNPFSIRREQQRKRLSTLPALFPTTTIGSFPQTKEVRAARGAFKNKKITFEEYDRFIRNEIENCVKIQEECGLDVLVHGEFERTDMVEYFGEVLEGFVLTQNGWVQSYGSRCVKPPIIYGDVNRANPMTLEYTTFAQSLTKKPMKGMLTGPVTILQWSFVRDDQPRSLTCNQIALSIRDEVQDLEKSGIACIQIDEPAIREGLPLRKNDWDAYLKWAVDSFLLSSTGVRDETQIHSHMCYSDFNDIFESIKRMDNDVLTIENSKSDLKLLRSFELYGYTNEIGPGLYDIHSPRVPTTEEMLDRVEKMLKYLPKQLIWVNPDCGLKTRGWKETKDALTNMVAVSD